ncbi:MAG: acyl carrier protein [Rhizonema sp. PD38]|nr:acyl carrier protein [Rhizonema sp. PD38]
MQTSADRQPFSDKNESQTEPKSLTPVFTKEAIETKLISELSQYLRVYPDEINIREPFTAYSLDSSVALDLTGELSRWIGCELEPNLLWEYPNIEALTQYLAAKCQ